ncbi:hypothetical protein ACTBAC_004695 [Vibrio parahaemolyticus]|nr:hypothetical protein [Vibrio parahaemolyticus]
MEQIKIKNNREYSKACWDILEEYSEIMNNSFHYDCDLFFEMNDKREELFFSMIKTKAQEKEPITQIDLDKLKNGKSVVQYYREQSKQAEQVCGLIPAELLWERCGLMVIDLKNMLDHAFMISRNYGSLILELMDEIKTRWFDLSGKTELYRGKRYLTEEYMDLYCNDQERVNEVRKKVGNFRFKYGV